MNSYFATVEQQANPLLRGKAVGVCAYLQPHGCIIAASIEAKARGMKVGMRVDEAKKIIPDSVFVENDPAKYRSVTSRIFSIFDEYSDRVERYSIDEAFLDMTGWVRDDAEATWIAVCIRERIRREVGDWLSCSIGIAPTRFLAKLASDREKPSGLVIITPDNLESVLETMELGDVFGIGRRMKKRIESLGYRTPLELKRAPVANLMQAFGVNGYFLWAKLNGLDVEDLHGPSEAPKSIGHSYCVPRRADVQKRARAILAKLAEKSARRLREHRLCTQRVFVMAGIRSSYRGSTHAQDRFQNSLSFRLDRPSSDSRVLVHRSLRLLDEIWDGVASLSFLAVTYADFVPPSDQLTLDFTLPIYSSGKNKSGSTHLSFTMDEINDRYGDQAIVFGSLFGMTKDDAPDRIGFRKIHGPGMGSGGWVAGNGFRGWDRGRIASNAGDCV